MQRVEFEPERSMQLAGLEPECSMQLAELAWLSPAVRRLGLVPVGAEDVSRPLHRAEGRGVTGCSRRNRRNRRSRRNLGEAAPPSRRAAAARSRRTPHYPAPRCHRTFCRRRRTGSSRRLHGGYLAVTWLLQAAQDRLFPTALLSSDLDGAIAKTLGARGFTPDNTLFAHSVCSDEVNHEDAVTCLLHCCHVVVTLLSRGCHMTATWLSHGCHMAATWLSHGCCTSVTPRLRCCYTWLLHGCCIARTLRLRGYYTATILPLPRNSPAVSR